MVDPCSDELDVHRKHVKHVRREGKFVNMSQSVLRYTLIKDSAMVLGGSQWIFSKEIWSRGMFLLPLVPVVYLFETFYPTVVVWYVLAYLENIPKLLSHIYFSRICTSYRGYPKYSLDKTLWIQYLLRKYLGYDLEG